MKKGLDTIAIGGIHITMFKRKLAVQVEIDNKWVEIYSETLLGEDSLISHIIEPNGIQSRAEAMTIFDETAIESAAKAVAEMVGCILEDCKTCQESAIAALSAAEASMRQRGFLEAASPDSEYLRVATPEMCDAGA
jgi:hypothetical protein